MFSRQALIKSIGFSITRLAAGDFGVKSIDAAVGFTGIVARLPMLCLLALLYVSVLRFTVGHFISALLAITIWLDFNSVLYFQVADVDEAHESALKLGAIDGGAPHLIAKMSDHELWMGFLKDPDDHLVGLMEERRPGNRQIEHGQENRGDISLLNYLSSRETQVLGLIAKGMRNKEIAVHLSIAEKTVKNHVSSILETLKVNSRTQAAMLAVKAKIT